MTTARATLDTAMSEAEWQAQVVELAKVEGWHCYHTHDSRRSEPGFPDLVMVRGVQLIILELKTETGVVTDAQQIWIDALDRVKLVAASVARPHHWGDVRRALEGARR